MEERLLIFPQVSLYFNKTRARANPVTKTKEEKKNAC